AAITAEQGEQRKRLEYEKRSRAQVLARIGRDMDQQRRKIGTMKRDEIRLTRLIDQLTRIKVKPPRRVHQRGAMLEASLRNERVPDASAPAGPFARLRGFLALPVKGELGNRFGSPRPDGGVGWK